ncbi:metabolite traffic protein EboE [Nocardioides hwasunensis]|uniref:Metabolite traffic protein EboE n=1 Tax=Nocardioides hwasunensis TaxID=397258 RepID=A0ABR8MMM6_9ACTN|nr:metabolite traffic protein EboE [Nocardioides hwasunensis]MBD3915779.1 metabolite traffic protein EboE [Nocardioides hwasunensis]
MRLRHPDGTVVHLGYGTNVLPAEDVEGLIDQVSSYGDRLRRHLDTDRIGLGMWLPAAAARRLAADPDSLHRLRDTAAEHGVEMVTLNAFPYAAFQDEVVKKRVYHPTWAEQARLDYTLDVARVLAALLPEDAVRGSISTLPLAWRAPWLADRQAHAELQLKALAEGLAEIEAETGRTVRVAFEPEPGCVIETIAEAVERLEAADRERLGVCLDLCHLAVGFEDAAGALERLDAAGLDVVKVQPAAALVVDDPADPDARAALTAYSEDRFLHQVRQQVGHRLASRDDLPDALEGRRPLDVRSPWRVHFHVPVHADPAPPLRNSREELRSSLAALLGGDVARTDHLEVETYTWSVLPDGAPADDEALAAGLAAELDWVHRELVALGLTPLD